MYNAFWVWKREKLSHLYFKTDFWQREDQSEVLVLPRQHWNSLLSHILSPRPASGRGAGRAPTPWNSVLLCHWLPQKHYTQRHYGHRGPGTMLPHEDMQREYPIWMLVLGKGLPICLCLLRRYLSTLRIRVTTWICMFSVFISKGREPVLVVIILCCPVFFLIVFIHRPKLSTFSRY